MTQKEQRRQLSVKRLTSAKILANEEGYEHLTVYKKRKDFIVYEAYSDMFKTLKPIYIVVEYYDNVPYLALKSVVDAM